MGLLEMSFTGAVLIIAVAIARAVTINRLPKKTFLILWGIVVLRLSVPFSISSVYSIYSLMPQGMGNGGVFVLAGYPLQQTQRQEAGKEGGADRTEEAAGIDKPDGDSGRDAMAGTGWRQDGVRSRDVVWITGCVLCFAFFGSLYVKCRRQFAVSLPVRNDFADSWIQEHRIRRPVQIRQSGMINAPLTYGLYRPVILVPENTDWENRKQLEYIFTHEYIHIRRFDVVTKMVLAVVLSVHWFNPFVWIMYILCNRDLELSCDEMVVRAFGEKSKSEYAYLLVNMEERKSGLMPLCSNFSNNATEKRIKAIMKIRKKSAFTIMLAAALVSGLGVTFATSAPAPDKSLEEIPQDDKEENTGWIDSIISEAENVRDSREIRKLAEFEAIKDEWGEAYTEEDADAGRTYAEQATDAGRTYAEQDADAGRIEMQLREERERLNAALAILVRDLNNVKEENVGDNRTEEVKKQYQYEIVLLTKELETVVERLQSSQPRF